MSGARPIVTGTPDVPAAVRGPGARFVAAYLLAYVALDWVSYIQPVGAFGITAWNPPPALSLAFVLRFGPRHAGWLFVAALLAEVVVRGFGTPPWVTVAAAAIPAIAYAAAGAALRRTDPFTDLASLRSMLRFLAAALVSTGVVAAGVVALYGAVQSPALDRATALAQSWIGDFVGIAITVPALLTLARLRRPWPRLTAVEAAQAAAVAASFWLVFGAGLGDETRLFHVLFLPLVWIAVRHGLPGATVAMVVIQLGLVAAVGRRPGALLDFQFLMLSLGVTGLLLGAAVSERRRIERTLRDKQFELERSLRMAAASELASALAHELQQPLTALGNYVRAGALIAAQGNDARPELAETMQKAVAQSDRASQVVRRMRDFFRAGRVTVEAIAPVALVDAAAAAARERAERHGIALSVATADALPDVAVDRLQVEGVLSNLLANAVDALKTIDRPRRIALGAERSDDGVTFFVDDDGPGVPAETVGRLFEHFATSKSQGMGLGLAISRSIIQAHGGRIWHEPRAPGASFRFALPLAP